MRGIELGVNSFHGTDGFHIFGVCDRCHTSRSFTSAKELADSGWIMGAGYKTYCKNCKEEVKKENGICN